MDKLRRSFSHTPPPSRRKSRRKSPPRKEKPTPASKDAEAATAASAAPGGAGSAAPLPTPARSPQENESLLRLLCILSGIPVLCGILSCALAIKELGDGDFLKVVLKSNRFRLSVIFLIIGGILGMLSAMVGIYGFMRRNKLVVYVYFGILFMSFGMLFAGGITGFTMRSTDKKNMAALRADLTAVIANYKVDNVKDEYTAVMDFIQIEFKCCGISQENEKPELSYKIWENQAKDLAQKNQKVPQSCCKDCGDIKFLFQKCSHSDEENFAQRNELDCLNELKMFIRQRGTNFLGCGIGLGTVILFLGGGVIFLGLKYLNG